MVFDINIHYFKWLCIFIIIGSITVIVLPYCLLLLLVIVGFLVLNGVRNRLKLSTTATIDRPIKPNPLLSILYYSPTQAQDQQSIIYVCINCNIVHTKHQCPRCKSKLKRRL